MNVFALRVASRCVACLTLGLVLGCSEGSEAERSFTKAADAIEHAERSGAIESAARDWRALSDDAPTRETRARAELGQARCEAALAARDHGRKLLESLSERVGSHSLAALDAIAAEQAARFVGGPFEREFRELQDEVRATCQARWQEARGRQAAIAREIVGRGEFTAALDYLQGIERERSPDDRSDIELLLTELQSASERAADQVVDQAAALAASDPTAALTTIDDAMARFQGTSGSAKLARARVERLELVRQSSSVRKIKDDKTPSKSGDDP